MSERRLLKWNLPPYGEQRVAVYRGTRPLAVGWQGSQLVLWTDHAPDTEPLEWVHVHVAMTGDPTPPGDYFGTAQLDDNGQPYVVHVFLEWPGPVSA